MRLIIPVKALDNLGNVGIISVSAFLVALYSSYQRPIWIDEFLHFAWGGFRDPASSFSLILEYTASGRINHGQTGFYMILNQALFQHLSAGSIALRLPSLLSAILLLVSVAWAIKVLGFTWPWQLAAVIAVGASPTLMYFAGEARPYMPLAAAVTFVLVAYLTRVTGSLNGPRSWLVYGVALFGCLMHPYFPLYVCGLALFSVAFALASRNTRSKGSLIQVANLPLVSFVLLCSGVVALLSWGRLSPGKLPAGAPAADYELMPLDPWEFVPSSSSGAIFFFMDSNVDFLASQLEVVLGLGVVLVTLSSFKAWKRQVSGSSTYLLIRLVVPPVMLLILALFSSAVISGASIVQDYWILERQWVASISLVAVGTVWLLASIYRWTSTHSRAASILLAVGVSGVLGFEIFNATRDQTSALAQYSSTAAYFIREYQTLTQEGQVSLFGRSPEDAANVNMYLGGPVWPVFSCFYGCEEGYENRP